MIGRNNGGRTVGAKRDKLEPVRGAQVRLLHDIRTRGGRVFRAGLRMRIYNDCREFGLCVSVRYRRFYLTLKKNEGRWYFEVIAPPRPKPENGDGDQIER